MQGRRKPVQPNARSKGVVLVTPRQVTGTCEQHSALSTVSTINSYGIDNNSYGIDNKYITIIISYTYKTEVDCFVPLAKVIFPKTGPAIRPWYVCVLFFFPHFVFVFPFLLLVPMIRSHAFLHFFHFFHSSYLLLLTVLVPSVTLSSKSVSEFTWYSKCSSTAGTNLGSAMASLSGSGVELPATLFHYLSLFPCFFGYSCTYT